MLSLSKALYINIPFCFLPCTFCHYKPNNTFGYDEIPGDYFFLLIEDLGTVCRNLANQELASVYLGGGTPSLLNDDQIQTIFSIFSNFGITIIESSIELHPGKINFNLNNNFFTRYSIGAQSFDDYTLSRYKREGYTHKDIVELVKSIRKYKTKTKINIDLMLDAQNFICEPWKTINELDIDSIVIYPDTRHRGTARLRLVQQALAEIKLKLTNFVPFMRSSYIFTRPSGNYSLYAAVGNESLGDIFSVGHNSISTFGPKSCLKRYVDGKIVSTVREEKADQRLLRLLRALSVGVNVTAIEEYFPSLMRGGILRPVSVDDYCGWQSSEHREMVYLPEWEYTWFFRKFLQEGDAVYARAFVSSIGHGDSSPEVITRIYNHDIAREDQILMRLPKRAYKLPAPKVRILIEGIDGSGKSTFAEILLMYLKKLFFYDEQSQLTIAGQPCSTLPYGKFAKKFVEDLGEGTPEKVVYALTQNRIASERRFAAMPGILILVRSFVTEYGTILRHFGLTNPGLGEGTAIGKWDYFIVVDADAAICDERIAKRGKLRTWRETPDNLEFFRQYFLDFTSPLLPDKLVVESKSLEEFHSSARSIAIDIYNRARVSATPCKQEDEDKENV